MDDVLTKKDMYNRLLRGEFGNITPQFLSLEEWKESPLAKEPLWGIRSLTPGGPCRLNCPRDEVERTVQEFQPHQCNISVMVDSLPLTLWADIALLPYGLTVYGIEYPKTYEGWTWRNSMPSKGKQWVGVTASIILRKHLNENSLDDLWMLLDRYPDHVVELTAIERCYGTVPHRNAVVWEVRKY